MLNLKGSALPPTLFYNQVIFIDLLISIRIRIKFIFSIYYLLVIYYIFIKYLLCIYLFIFYTCLFEQPEHVLLFEQPEHVLLFEQPASINPLSSTRLHQSAFIMRGAVLPVRRSRSLARSQSQSQTPRSLYSEFRILEFGIRNTLIRNT
jgi:hypothetical protein